MAGRKRNSAEDIVRKLRRADELAAEGKTGEEIAAGLQVWPATLYNWRRTYGGMDTDAAKSSRNCASRTPAAPPFGPGLPHAGRARCHLMVHPHPGGLHIT